MPLVLSASATEWRKNKTLIAAAYNGLTVDVTESKALPTLSTSQGPVVGADSSAKYVAGLSADSPLLGRGFYESIQVDSWLEWVAVTVEPARDAWILPVQKVKEFDGKAYAFAKKDIGKCLGMLNNHLVNETYLVGNSVTLADISVVAAFFDLFSTVLAPNFIKNFGNVTRWFKTCVNQPEFKKVLGEITFATTEERAPKPVKKAEPKKEKKVEAKPVEAPKKKVVNPLNLLPPSSMILDNEKKQFFLKQPYNPEFFPSFWDRFDAEGYSFFKCEYSYNEENKVFFMTQNLVGGFIQRTDPARKWAFGCEFILGKDETSPPFTVKGCWLFRGAVIPQEMHDNPDSEWHKFEKLDVSKAEDKQYIVDCYTADIVDGLTVLDRRYFK